MPLLAGHAGHVSVFMIQSDDAIRTHASRVWAWLPETALSLMPGAVQVSSPL